MDELTPETLNRAVWLIDQLRDGNLPDYDRSEILGELDSLLPDPHWTGYAVNQFPEIPAEDVVRRAFLYPPIES
jgi:hypothetical protein